MPVTVPVPETERKEAFWKAIIELVRLKVNVTPLSVTDHSASKGVEGLKIQGAAIVGTVPTSMTANDPVVPLTEAFPHVLTPKALLRTAVGFPALSCRVRPLINVLGSEAKLIEPEMDPAFAAEPSAKATSKDALNVEYECSFIGMDCFWN